MENIFSKLGLMEPHTLQQVRASIDTDVKQETPFIAVLKEHHGYLEESISVLVDLSASIEDKRAHLSRFFHVLEMHAKAEQETLYEHLQHSSEEEARLEGFGGEDEHDIVLMLKGQLESMGFRTSWNDEIGAKAKVVAMMVRNHIKEEESIMFPIAKRDLSVNEMEEMRVDYLSKCQKYFMH